jgi:xanthine dehydrogenase YagS FAD-binding subunit
VQSFTYRAATTKRDAIDAVLEGGRYIAGGTTLVDLMREEVERPERIVDINALPLRSIDRLPDRLIIGALARMSDVAANPVVAKTEPLVVQALLEGASPQIRNMASIGGNLLQRVRCPYFRALDAACNKREPGSGCAAIDGVNYSHAIFGTSDHCVATHPSDLAVALVALDAVAHVSGADGDRQFLVEDLYRLPADTPHLEHTLLRGELIAAVSIPRTFEMRYVTYLKIRDRASYEFALVSVAAALEIEDGTILNARIAAGGVATKPWRLRQAEAALGGQRAGAEAWRTAADNAVAGARPLVGNAYKVELLRRAVIRALQTAASR